MILLSAALFFLPHYSVTQLQQPVSVVSDANGNAYVVSTDANNVNVGWLTKVDRDGRVIYRVVLSHEYVGGAIFATADGQGNVYAAVGGYEPGSVKFFAVKLDASGAIVYHLALGPGSATAPAVGPDGSAYFTGGAYPVEWMPTTPGAWVSTSSAPRGETNAYVVKIGPAGDRIVYSTFLNSAPTASGPAPGYPVLTIGAAIAVDSLGFGYVTGITSDPAYPATPGAFQTQCPNCGFGNSLFVSKLSPDGSHLVYSTYLGRADGAYFLSPVQTRLDPSGSLQVVTVAGGAAIRAKALGPDGSGLILDTMIALDIKATAPVGLVAVSDGQGNLLVSGKTNQLDLSPTEGALQNGPATVAVLRASDGAILYSTRLLPSRSFYFSRNATGIAPDGSGGFIVLGNAGTSDQAWTLTRFVPSPVPRTSIFGVANAAESDASASLAPGELVSIYGVSVGPALPIAATYDASGRLPYTLGGAQVRFNGIPAPIVSVANQQVVAEVPFGLTASGTVKVELVQNGAAANSAEFPASAVEPQVFQGPPDGFGLSYALALNEDGSLNSANNPAIGGSVVSLFLNGAGALTPAPEDGAAGGPAGPKVNSPGFSHRLGGKCRQPAGASPLRRGRAGARRDCTTEHPNTAAPVFTAGARRIRCLYRDRKRLDHVDGLGRAAVTVHPEQVR